MNKPESDDNVQLGLTIATLLVVIAFIAGFSE